MSKFFDEVLRYRGIAVVLSVIVIFVGVAGIAYRGGLLYGIDFTGGLRMMYEFTSPIKPNQMNEIRETLSDLSRSTRVKTFSFEGEQDRRGLMLTVRTRRLVDRLTNQLRKHSDLSSDEYFKRLKNTNSLQWIDMELIRKNFRVGEGDAQKLNIQEASRSAVRDRVQTIVNEHLTRRIVNQLQNRFRNNNKSIDLNWASKNEIQEWLRKRHLQAFVNRLQTLKRNQNPESIEDVLPILKEFSISRDEFTNYYSVGTQKEGTIDILSRNVDKLRDTFNDDFFKERYGGIAQRIVDKRSEQSLFHSLEEVLNLPAMQNVNPEIIKQSAGLSPFVMIRSEMVSPAIGADLIWYAGLAILLSMIGILVYLYFRFHFTYSVGALLAIVHDVIATIGLLTLIGVNFDVPVVAAVLTVIGYSLNDTIVNFDRVRENRVLMGYKSSWYEVINRSVREVLNRTFVTSITTFIAVLVLFLYGGIALRGFSITLLIGVIVGTYSSIYVSNSVLYQLQKSIDTE